MTMNKLLEESERLLFRSAVTISETDILIERSLRLIRNTSNEERQAAAEEIGAVGHCLSLPTNTTYNPGEADR